MKVDDVLSEAIRVAVMSLREEECVGTVAVGDLAWDVYVHKLPAGTFAKLPSKTGKPFEAAISLALRLEGDKVKVAFMVPGILTLGDAARMLHEAHA